MKKNRPINRPKNLNLFTIRLPINAVVSILHRASGVALFLLLPLLLWLLQISVKNEYGYLTIANLAHFWLAKVMLVCLAWAFFHHFFAGLRHLGQDVHWMTTLQKARFSGRAVLWLVGVSVIIFTWAIW
jgi:succinate dehydrogenase / fumarate reductase cytochrome b subunit